MLFLNNMYLLKNQLKNIRPSSFKIDAKNRIFVNTDKGVDVFNGNKPDLSLLKKPRITIIEGLNLWFGDIATGKSVIYCDTKPKTTVPFLATVLGNNIKNFLTKNYLYPRVYLDNNLSKPQYARISRKNVLIDDVFPNNIGLNGIYQVLNDNLFLSQNNEKFGVFNFENTCIWQHSYSELLNSDKAFLSSDIIVHKEKLYFFLAGTPNNKTFCIDIKTGKIEHIYKELKMFSYIEDDLLYTLFNKKLNILNTITQEIKTIDFTGELKKYNIYTDQNFAVQNGLIYFKQSMGADVARIGILDPKTAKLIWKYDLPKGSGQVGSIQVQGDRIYVHTQDKTLHIFEKQKTTIA